MGAMLFSGRYFSGRLSQSAFDRPIMIQAGTKGVFAYTDHPCPLSDSHGLSTKSNIDIVSAIVGLLFSRNPSAIFGGVGTIIINAVKCVFFAWSFPHIIIKSIEGVFPSFANFNTPAAIKRIIFYRLRRAVASSFHPKPCFVFWSSFHPMFGITGITIGATTGSAIFKSTPKNNTFVPAFAPAQPIRAMLHMSKLDYSPFAKLFSSKIESFLRHCFSPLYTDVLSIILQIVLFVQISSEVISYGCNTVAW